MALGAHSRLDDARGGERCDLGRGEYGNGQRRAAGRGQYVVNGLRVSRVSCPTSAREACRAVTRLQHTLGECRHGEAEEHAPQNGRIRRDDGGTPTAAGLARRPRAGQRGGKLVAAVAECIDVKHAVDRRIGRGQRRLRHDTQPLGRAPASWRELSSTLEQDPPPAAALPQVLTLWVEAQPSKAFRLAKVTPRAARNCVAGPVGLRRMPRRR